MSHVKNRKLPADIPACPHTHYKNKGWMSYGDWLGNNNIAPKNVKFMSHDKAMKFVHTLKLKSQREWQAYCKSGNKPNDIPYTPSRYYKKTGWTTWGNWLGSNVIAPQNKLFLSFEEARNYTHSLQIKSQKEWKKFCLRKNIPSNIPSGPNEYYKESGWISWGDWLGTYSINSRDKPFLSFEKARNFINSLGLQTVKQFRAYCISGNKPTNIPSNPNNRYKNSGWISWPDWLGTKK